MYWAYSLIVHKFGIVTAVSPKTLPASDIAPGFAGGNSLPTGIGCEYVLKVTDKRRTPKASCTNRSPGPGAVDTVDSGIGEFCTRIPPISMAHSPQTSESMYSARRRAPPSSQ